jgi:hypothetical protein
LPTSLTGSAPGMAAGQRSRTRWSAPVKSSTCVVASIRSEPCQSVNCWVYRSGPTAPVTVTRSPSGLRSTSTDVAGACAEACTGAPLGSRCHGPSWKRGCAGYSSYTRSSLPNRPGCSSSRPVRLSHSPATPPPRSGSTVSR